jgi:hypothetical protein
MEAKLADLLIFLNTCWQQRSDQKAQRGKPVTYSQMSVLLFFMVMNLKKIHQFKTMHKWAKEHHQKLGWQQAPDRKTIRRRFLALPAIIQLLMPAIAQHCRQLNHAVFGYACSFADKTVFRALGGLWHKVHMLVGVVPHSSIDTEASWAKSDYHGWRFGYGLHLICNRHRFPLMATVTTASTKDYTLLTTLVAPLRDWLGMVVADKGYFASAYLEAVYQQFKVLVITPALFKIHLTMSPFERYYNELVDTWAARITYRRRKPSIEPTFAHLKDLTGLTGEHQLPYRGLARVSSYLLVTSCLVQLMMYDNYSNGRELGCMNTFRNTFQ